MGKVECIKKFLSPSFKFWLYFFSFSDHSLQVTSGPATTKCDRSPTYWPFPYCCCAATQYSKKLLCCDSLMDTIIHWRRMSGFSALWVAGMNHAEIATQILSENDAAPVGCAVSVVNEAVSVYLKLQGTINAEAERIKPRKKMEELQKLHIFLKNPTPSEIKTAISSGVAAINLRRKVVGGWENLADYNIHTESATVNRKILYKRLKHQSKVADFRKALTGREPRHCVSNVQAKIPLDQQPLIFA
ncbi:hypothetical protein ACH5RR_024855 [Cinchona calisaya]|uniref:valine--tRNA ligase n=1 Tax=Cinchona calisaya TaxID=153742 RepID=A0ABD2YZ20_9GENT